MNRIVDLNALVDQLEWDEERDNRRFGNYEFDYIGNNQSDNTEE
jgi:hypothetical protein